MIACLLIYIRGLQYCYPRFYRQEPAPLANLLAFTGSGPTHCPATQVPPEHSRPHAPQLRLSFCKFLQLSAVVPHRADVGAAQGQVVVVETPPVAEVTVGVKISVTAGT